MINKLRIKHNGTDEILGSVMSLSVTDEVNNESNIVPGSAIASMLQFSVWGKSADTVSVGDEILLLQAEDENETPLAVNKYYATKPIQRTKSKFEVVAYDAISKLDVDMSEHLTEEAFEEIQTIDNLIDKVSEVTGVTIYKNNLSLAVRNAKINYLGSITLTARQIMSAIAQLNCSYLIGDGFGSVQFGWFEKNDVEIQPSGNGDNILGYKQDGLVAEDYVIEPITGVALINSQTNIKTVYPSEAEGNILAISNNPILDAISTDEDLIGIGTRLYMVMRNTLVDYTEEGVPIFKNIKPCSISLFRSMKVNVGDIIKVTDSNGEQFETFVMRKELSDGGTSISCTSEQNYSSYSSTAIENSGNGTIDGKRIISMSADKIKTGRIESTNGNTYFDLDEGDLVSYETVETDRESVEEKTTLDSGSIKFERNYNYHHAGNEESYNCQIYIGNRYGNIHRGIELVVEDEDYEGTSLIPNITSRYASTGVTNTLNEHGLEVSKFDGEAYHSSEIRADGALIDGDLELNGNITGSYDSGWTYLKNSNLQNFILYSSNGFVRYRKVGKTIEVDGIIQPSSEISANSTTTAFTVPYKPSRNVLAVCQGTGMNRYLVTINTSGAFTISKYGITTNIAIPTSARLDFNVTYFID